MSGTRLRLNPIGCDAHGLCAGVLPEMITLDEWGYPILDGREVPDHLLAHARRAVAACPTLALALVRPAGPAGPGTPPGGPGRPVTETRIPQAGLASQPAAVGTTAGTAPVARLQDRRPR